MRVVLALLIVALAYVNAKLATADEQRAQAEAISKECKSKHDITEADIALLWQHKIPDSETGKCFAGCISQATGVMTADNKVGINRIVEIMDSVKDRLGAEYEPMRKAFEACVPEVSGANECEATAKLMECCNKELQAANIKSSYMKILLGVF